MRTGQESKTIYSNWRYEYTWEREDLRENILSFMDFTAQTAHGLAVIVFRACNLMDKLVIREMNAPNVVHLYLTRVPTEEEIQLIDHHRPLGFLFRYFGALPKDSE